MNEESFVVEQASIDIIKQRIEICCLNFLQSLVAAESSPTASVSFTSERLQNCDRVYAVRLSNANVHSFTFVARALCQIYTLLVSESSATKRDLFYEQKDLYGEQRNLDSSVTKVCKLLLTSRTGSNVLAGGRGIMMGNLKIVENGTVLDCSASPVVIKSLSSNATLISNARFILVVEKEATFQKLIQEDFFFIFHPALLVTGKGYPDIATRQLLKNISSANNIPAFGLVDSDPHGIEIFITYKYGTKKPKFETGNCNILNFEWIGLSRLEASRYPIPEDQFLRMNKREIKKISGLRERVSMLKDWVLLRELDCLLNSGSKLELEAVSGIAPGFLCRKVLADKLVAFVRSSVVE
uniref:DNA topoisomerase (ATP-hydrolyzing) n=1 Tax=Syphacia muris TaxID=451379 RepID=A0A0N5AQJ5_9BILA